MDAQHGSLAHSAVEGESVARYAAFLLRVWCSDGDGDGQAGEGWRIVLEEVGAEERHGFTEWDALVQHICAGLVTRRES